MKKDNNKIVYGDAEWASMTTGEKHKASGQIDRLKATFPRPFNQPTMIANNKGVGLMGSYDVRPVWLSLLGNKDYVTKEERQQIDDINKEIEAIENRQAKYTQAEARKAYESQDLDNPDKVKTWENISKTYGEILNKLIYQAEALRGQALSVLVEPQARLEKDIEKMNLAKMVEDDFVSVCNKWNVPLSCVAEHVDIWKRSHEAFMKHVKSRAFTDITFFKVVLK
ncbi:MAG: hypothetical protein U1G07_05845 [Verrucomicrobiota bacterium]